MLLKVLFSWVVLEGCCESGAHQALSDVVIGTVESAIQSLDLVIYVCYGLICEGYDCRALVATSFA